MNRTLTTMLKRWGEYRPIARKLDLEYSRLVASGDLEKDELPDPFSYASFMNWWYEKEKDNLEVEE